MSQNLISNFRGLLLDRIRQLALEPVELRARLRVSRLPPEELRLQWEDYYTVLERGNEEALALFTQEQLDALRAFDDYIWALPPEPDMMWNWDHLDQAPWPTVRLRARQLLAILAPIENANDHK